MRHAIRVPYPLKWGNAKSYCELRDGFLPAMVCDNTQDGPENDRNALVGDCTSVCVSMEVSELGTG